MVGLAASTGAATAPARLALLWVGVALLLFVFTPILVLTVRRASIGPDSPRRARDRRPRDRVDAWSEAGRRASVQPDAGRLDDTVDFDPNDPRDGGGW
ncbi:MAG: hypothetical protein D6693_07930 [Planctomycetota bacterium]|nr:MAG: hypothetical protein D6693_07930 [Planctomycetota bacterium]